MKSGLEGRNNYIEGVQLSFTTVGLNEVRPRRPEQCITPRIWMTGYVSVSMKSGLEGRNNRPRSRSRGRGVAVSMKSGLEGRNNE